MNSRKKEKLMNMLHKNVTVSRGSDEFTGGLAFGFINKDNLFVFCSPHASYNKESIHNYNRDIIHNPGLYVLNAKEDLAYKMDLRNIQTTERNNKIILKGKDRFEETTW